MRTARARLGALGAALALALALVLCARPAGAQSMRRFQQYLSQAQRAYERGDADAAIRLLERAYAIRPVPQLLFNIARAHEQAGRLELAVEYYDRFLATDPPADQADAARQLRAAAQQTIDARTRPPVPEGNRQGSAIASTRPAPRLPPAGRVFGAGHGTLIVGGTLLTAAGVVFGVLALNAAAQFSATTDPAMRAGLQDRGTGFAWGANAGIGLGVLAVGLGLVLYFAQPVHSQAVSAAPTGP